MEFKKIKLEILSPVHIGTGETLDPFSYVIRNDENGPSLHYIDLSAWVEDHPDPAGLAQSFSKSTVAAVRSFVSENIDTAVYTQSSARVISREIYDEYRERLRDPNNQLKISPALKNAYNRALIIPGSSIKGAIRTAVIDYLDCRYKLDLKNLAKEGGRYENKLGEVLGKIGDNDFKNLKIGDFEAFRDDSYFVSAKEISRNSKKNNTPKDPCEVTPSRLLQGKPVTIYGKVGIGAINLKGNNRLSVNRNRDSWDLEGLMCLCTEFYRVRYRQEKEKFYTLPHFEQTAEALKAIDEAVLNTKPGEMVLRIGHYSHVECMTITDNEPYTRIVKGKQMPFGTTRTLAQGIYPFGWVKLSVCSDEEYARYFDEKRAHDSSVEAAYAAKRQSVQDARKVQHRELLARENQKREAEELKAKRKAELDAMTYEERALFLLRRNELLEHEVIQLFHKLDDMTPDMQKECAATLKAFWQKEGKWGKKGCSRKQWEKVQKVKNILGEG